MKPRNRFQEGLTAQLEAERYLTQQGLKLLTRNFSCRSGEIDLIFIEKKRVVFVEVRSTTHHPQVAARETIHWHKQRRLIQTAEYFLTCRSQYANYVGRFDVVALEKKEHGEGYHLEWIPNAFELS